MIKIFNKKAFSLVEIIVAVAIASIIFLLVFNFGNDVFFFNSNAQKNLSAQTDARRMLKSIVDIVKESAKSLSICGEIAADTNFLPLLVGLGFENISVDLHSIPTV